VNKNLICQHAIFKTKIDMINTSRTLQHLPQPPKPTRRPKLRQDLQFFFLTRLKS